MFYVLTEQIQRIFEEVLRQYWQYHPRFQDLAGNIQGKYAFSKRPQHGIILKNSSGNFTRLSADNYQGALRTYVYLAHQEGSPGTSLEWVRENALAIQENGGRFPSPPGVYYIDFHDDTGRPTDEAFYLETLLDVYAETVPKIGGSIYRLQRGRFLPGTLRLFLMPGSVLLDPGTHYTAQAATGVIQVSIPMAPGDYLSADYRYAAQGPKGPFKVIPERALIHPIPGAVLAFGRRIVPGDRLAVMVHPTRKLSVLEYGNRTELSLDMDIVSRDVLNMREIVDQTMMFLEFQARAHLAPRGIEIVSVGHGGESEEPYDPNTGENFYTASLSVQVQTDCSVHIPVAAWVRSLVAQTPLAVWKSLPGLPEEVLAELGQEMPGLSSTMSSLGLVPTKVDPFYFGKTEQSRYAQTQEMIY